jgi:hypothetical protein
MAEERLTPSSLAGLEVKPVHERSRYINVLFYGDSGVGKTTLAGSADAVEEMSPVLFIDIEGGTESLQHSFPRVQTVRVRTWQDMQNVYSELYDGKHPFKTIVLDSLTEIQKFNMYMIMGKTVEDHPERDIDVPSMREWGKNLEQIRRLVRGFRDLEMHTIFTALARNDKNEKTGVTTTKPSLSGKMADEVAAFLDLVCYYYVKQIGEGEEAEFKRLLLTQKTDSQIAKDRSGALPMIMEYPTMQQIYDLVLGRPQDAVLKGKVLQDATPQDAVDAILTQKAGK